MTEIVISNAQREANQQYLRQLHRRQFINKLILTIVTAIIVLVFVFPIFYWARLSITPYKYVFTTPPRYDFPEITTAWWSVVVGGRSYSDVIMEQIGNPSGVGGAGVGGYDIRPRIWNSVRVAGLSTLIVIVVATFTAYALSRFDLRSKQSVVFFILSTRFMPGVAVVLPLFLMYRQLGLYDTLGGLVLAHVVINLPIAILLLKSFFDDIPRDLDDAAMVDGCTRFGAFWRILVRYIAPGLAAAAVLCFIFSWNEFLFSLYLTRTPELQTVPVTIRTYDASAGTTEWGMMSAAGTAAIVPVFVFVLFVQRYLIRGLTLGAVRG
jgi:multiple sugar transport system permease protein